MLGSTRDGDVLFSNGVLREVYGKDPSTFNKINGYEVEFFAFKLHETVYWSDKSFNDVWAMVTWNDMLKRKYKNLIIFLEIARVQCISTASCAKGF